MKIMQIIFKPQLYSVTSRSRANSKKMIEIRRAMGIDMASRF